MQYVNRTGDTYYIFQGTTKTGKPKYFASKRASSDKAIKVDSLPGEFEIYENPANATVCVRRRKPSRVLPSERELVARLTSERSACPYFQTVIDADRIVIYTPDTDANELSATLREVLGATPSAAAEWARSQTGYSAALRFTIHDVDQRTYVAERYCHRSSVDGWIGAGGPMSLEPLAKHLVSRIGRESFHELF